MGQSFDHGVAAPAPGLPGGGGALEICGLSAVELASLLRHREVSAGEVLEAVFERAEEVQDAVNPFSVRLDERARHAAADADRALKRGDGGRLCGLPVTIKDSHWLAGTTSSTGSRTAADFVAPETCAAVGRLEDAGAVIFAKTTTPEFCYFGITESPLYGRTSNPWNLERTPGGSSGGAGAALAARVGPLALGGDGGGSIRIPSAFCGLVGFKPTFGRVPREPCSPAWKTLVAYGPMAHSVADARMMLTALAGHDPRDRHSLIDCALGDDLLDERLDPQSLRAVISEDLGFAPLDDDVRRAFRDALGTLARTGAQLVEDNPGLRSSVQTWSAIATAEARVGEAVAFEQRRELLAPATAEFLGHGDRVSMPDYVSAQMAREHIHRAYCDLFERTGATVLLTPTLGCEAFAHGSTHPDAIGERSIESPWTDWCGMLYDANLAGLPACSVPIGLGDDGLPIGMQILGPRGADAAVLDVARVVERAVGFAERPRERLSES